ncbi:hypothetical protein [Nonomuraea sp. NPDC049784]|uniref:alpha/beta fold hydrolase n=1 Tax=Nonomuraea sp. NPDC049784 TaxID=3154361 RepID=UPI0033FD8080
MRLTAIGSASTLRDAFSDMQIIRELADTAQDYTELRARVLLLGGSKSPAYFSVALDKLAAVLPHARRMTLTGLGHSGPENDGDPVVVAQALRDFFDEQ